MQTEMVNLKKIVLSPKLFLLSVLFRQKSANTKSNQEELLLRLLLNTLK